MKELELDLLNELIPFYEKYIKLGDCKETQIIAESIYCRYLTADQMLSELLQEAKDLFLTAHPNHREKYKIMNIEDAKMMLNKLKKYKKHISSNPKF